MSAIENASPNVDPIEEFVAGLFLFCLIETMGSAVEDDSQLLFILAVGSLENDVGTFLKALEDEVGNTSAHGDHCQTSSNNTHGFDAYSEELYAAWEEDRIKAIIKRHVTPVSEVSEDSDVLKGNWIPKDPRSPEEIEIDDMLDHEEGMTEPRFRARHNAKEWQRRRDDRERDQKNGKPKNGRLPKDKWLRSANTRFLKINEDWCHTIHLSDTELDPFQRVEVKRQRQSLPVIGAYVEIDKDREQFLIEIMAWQHDDYFQTPIEPQWRTLDREQSVPCDYNDVCHIRPA